MAIATRAWRFGNMSFLDAFVRSGDGGPRVVLVGCDVHLPDGGRNLKCVFQSGAVTAGWAVGNATDLSWPRRSRYMAWSCPVPASIYDASAEQLRLRLVPDGHRGYPLRATVRPYSAAALGGRVRVGAATMVRNAISGERSSVVEAIEYHRLIGFERWYVYDNNSTDGTRRLFRRYEGVVTVVEWPYFLRNREGNNRVQRAALNHALYAFGPHTTWLGARRAAPRLARGSRPGLMPIISRVTPPRVAAFLDLDEFLVLPSTLAWPPQLPRTLAQQRAFLAERRDTRSPSKSTGQRDGVACVKAMAGDGSGGSTEALPAAHASPPTRGGGHACSWGTQVLVLQARDRESPAATDCGWSSPAEQRAGGRGASTVSRAHTRRVVGCTWQYALPDEVAQASEPPHWPSPKVFLRVDPTVSEPMIPILSPHYYAPNQVCVLGCCAFVTG